MMICTVSREKLLKPLQALVAIADKKHSMPILSSILFEANEHTLRLSASDLDTEVIVDIPLSMPAHQNGIVAIPARKLFEIVKNITDQSEVEIALQPEHKVLIKANKSRFMISALDGSAFPIMQQHEYKASLTMDQFQYIQLIKRVQFAMANNDIRYFLNGMLWEIESNTFKVVATDGHRMAVSECLIEDTQLDRLQVIAPRKAITELQKVLSPQEGDTLQIDIASNHFKITFGDYQFTSKLVDGRYPDYERVLPKNNDKVMIAPRNTLKNSLIRTAILANEKYRGVRLQVEHNVLNISANNPDHEEAQDQIEVQYNYPSIEIGFNVSYLLDVLGVLDSESVDFYLSNPAMSMLIKDDTTQSRYVIMPIRL